MFKKAEKSKLKARIAIDGPSGSGKTYTALVAAKTIGAKVAVIDTERGSASLYADKFDFDVLELSTFPPSAYIAAIKEAENSGYDVIVIDSLSHAWEGEGGVLDMHDAATKRQRTENSFTAWKEVTPQHRALVDAMLQSKCHIIATMRSKTEYVLEQVERNGRSFQQPKKVGMAPVQRAGMEYEFTLVADMDIDHNIVITKSRCEAMADKVQNKPGEAFWKIFTDWLNSGKQEAPKQQAQKMTLEQAMQTVGSDGTAYTARTDDQLNWVVKNPKSPEDKREAARLILEKRQADRAAISEQDKQDN